MGKLGWYFEKVEGWTTLFKEKEPYIDWDSRGPDDPPTDDQKAETVRILNAHEKMLKALKEIAESPHRYFEDKHGTYVLGVADGHRFCAKIAEAAIANEE